MNVGMCFIIAAAIIVIALVVVHKKHHGSGGCMRNCAKCPNPCHHKGRF